MKKSILFYLLVIILTFTACDGSIKKLKANDIIYEDSFELPFKASKAFPGGDHIYFNIDKSLQDMKESIDSEKYEKYSISASLHLNQFLLIEKLTADSKLHYYMIAKSSDDWFYYFVPSSCINNSDVRHILTPFHLFELELPKNGEIYSIEMNRPYKTNVTIDDFKKFYEKIEIFDVSIENSILSIKVKDKEQIHGNHYENNFTIEFTSQDSIQFATYIVI